ncbi:L-lysine 6-monooxygenase (NADPH-requiring)-domain-containing protein [Schizophyllum commune]
MSEVYDLIGLGYGPANVAIGGALVERWEKDKTAPQPSTIKKVLFVEKQDKFRWHPGMLLPDARMQISYLKDLATLRNPSSPITFLSYLHAHGRLLNFINRGCIIPTRKEFADYLGWVAQYVQDRGVEVKYGHEVIGLEEAPDGLIDVRVRAIATGETIVLKAKDVVISPGGSPRLPDCVKPVFDHPNIIHSSSYMADINNILGKLKEQGERPLTIGVIGAGQSAAEILLELRNRLSSIPSGSGRHQVKMVMRRGALRPSDDSPFTNEIFDPESTGAWYETSNPEIRKSRLQEYKSTNYSVVNPRTLDSVYDAVYDQKVDDAIAARPNGVQATSPRVTLLPYSHILSLNTPPSAPLSLVIQHTISRTVSEESFDAIICATGYQRSGWVDLLKASGLGKRFGLDASAEAVQLMPSSSIATSPLTSPTSPPGLATSSISSPSSSAGPSTPVMSASTFLDADMQPRKMYISRNYRLLPVEEQGKEQGKSAFQGRIYLQGVEEATHGLSDSLLSVLGVRAGEVVGDMYA